MDRIPILKMGDYLLVTVQVDMHDRLAMTLQEDLADRIVKARARAVLIDISALEVVDSFIGRMLGTIAAIARVLDAETVVVGMRPAVARARLGLAAFRCRSGRHGRCREELDGVMAMFRAMGMDGWLATCQSVLRSCAASPP